MVWKTVGATLIAGGVVFIAITIAFPAGDVASDPSLSLGILLGIGGVVIVLLALILDALRAASRDIKESTRLGEVAESATDRG